MRTLLNSGYKLTALNSYPIYDEKFRPVLNQYIINHFYFREIGFESADMFNFYLSNSLNEIMPYYNEMFKSTLIDIDPLTNYSYKESSNRKNVGTNTSTISHKNKNVFSKPADGLLQFNDIENNIYATNATIGDNVGNDSENMDATTDYLRNISGVNGISQSELIVKYRKAIINVVQMLLEDKNINQCFMGVYGWQ